MSIFAGGLSLESAEALGQAIGFSSVDSLEAVTTLVESGLALRAQTSQGTVRFALFETIREFGLEQLEQAGELEATRRFHAEHFLAFASRETPQPDELVRIAWVVQLSGEHTNLMQAFDFLCTPETVEQSLRFAAALGPYWQIRGPSSEAAPRIQRVLALSPPEPTTLWMQVLYWASCVLGISHDYQGALQAAHQCMEIARQIGTPSDMACALQALAWVQEYHEQFDTARGLLEQALERWTSVGNMAMQAVCLMLHGGLEYAAGNFERARREAQQARETFQAVGDLGWTAGATWYEGIIAVAEGRLGLAAACYAQSLRDWTQSESSSRWFKPLVGLADVAAAIGQYPISARLLGAADEMIAVSGRGLMPFDKPGYERAREACIRALGSEEFEALIAAGRRLVPEEWLAESNAIVESARAFRSRDA